MYIAGLENHFNSSYSLTVSTLDDSVSLLVRTPRRTHYMPENIFSTPSKPTNISHSTSKEAPCSSNKRSKNDSSILEELLQVCKGILGHVTAIEARQNSFDQENVLSSPSSPAASSLPSTPTAPAAVEKNDPISIPRELISFCEQTRKHCLSVGHFATILTKHIFSVQEREGRNCLGKRNKLALDPVKLGLVKKLIFCYYPARKEENKEATWKQCITRIDKMLRRKTRRSSTTKNITPDA